MVCILDAAEHGVHGHELGTQKRALFEPAYDQMGV